MLVNLTERIEGGLLGLLVGDALGVPYEFHRASQIPSRKQIEMEAPPDFQRSHHRVPAGTWSDDGATALCLLDSLLTKGTMDLGDFSSRLVAWATQGLWAVDGDVFDIGNQTAAAIQALRSGVSPRQSGFVRPRGKGNGSLMRVLPLALWHCGEDTALVQDAHEQSLVTHGHITNQVCCALYCLWARRLLEGVPKQEAFSAAVSSLRTVYGEDSDYRQELELHVQPDERPVTDGSGYVLSTLHCARLAVQEKTFERAVRRAISYGEDTDTNAAVTGGLMGIVLGVDGIPTRWLDQLRGRSLVTPTLERLTGYRLRNLATPGAQYPEDIPSADADFERIWDYALTFNGYLFLGDDDCEAFANRISEQYHETGLLPEDISLEELRSCLFFEQRRYRWSAPYYEDEQFNLVRALMTAIRKQLTETQEHNFHHNRL